MELPQYQAWEWAILAFSAFSSGVGKAGLAGFGMLGVVGMAMILPGRSSTGVVLPLLIVADIIAASSFRKHIEWHLIRRLGAPIAVGVVLGTQLLKVIPDHLFKPILGTIILVLVVTHWIRQWRSGGQATMPSHWLFAWGMGLLVGITTMLANAAGPIATVYLLALGLAKDEFVHTNAWLFLFVNLFKVPFMTHLDLINVDSLSLNLVLVPALLCGMAVGVWTVKRLSRQKFELIVLILAFLSAVKLLIPSQPSIAPEAERPTQDSEAPENK